MKSCPEDNNYQCELCFEGVLLKDKEMHSNIRCKKLMKERNLPDIYECPLCGEKLPKKDRSSHEAFYCETLLQIDRKIHSLPNEQKSRSSVPKSDQISDDVTKCHLCREYIPWDEYEQHIMHCSEKNDFRECPHCDEIVPTFAWKDHKYKTCQMKGNLIDLNPEEEDFNNKGAKPQQQKISKIVKPKVGKCGFCKRTLNDNLLLLHEQECVHKTIRCGNCYATIILKDVGKHHCKSSKGKGAESSKSDISKNDKDDSEDETSSEDEISNDAENKEKKNVSSKIKGIRKLAQNLKQVFIEERMTDAILKVENREFKVHKIILIARSPVFASMFEHDMVEKKDNAVDILDCTAESFEIFLHYLYSGKLNIPSASNVYNVYYAADKYRVDDLKEKCVTFMIKNLSIDTFCDVIALSLRHGESELQKVATTFFCENIKKIIKTVQWQKYMHDNSTQANELLIKALNA